jgi:hypothetical protein
MLPSRIVKGAVDVDARLHHLFGLKKEELVRIAHAALIGRNDSTGIDPVNAKGILMYICGTREMRRILLPKGWRIDRTDSIEATYSEQRRIKIIYQNTDTAAETHREPKAISGKGPAAVRMVETSQFSLFPEWQDTNHTTTTVIGHDKASAWFFCVAMNGDEIVAELCCPRSVEGDQFSGFHERIFILQSGEWGGFDLSKFEPRSPDIDVIVSRK